MMTVHELSALAGVSIRTLHYYDQIGLLHPTGRSESGYRLYDDANLFQLREILLFREMDFSLKEIISIQNKPESERKRILEQQIEQLKRRKEHIERLIDFATEINHLGGTNMDYTPFDRSKLERYSKEAKELYGNSPEYREMQEKRQNRAKDEDSLLADHFMLLFKEAGDLKQQSPASDEAQALVGKIQQFITEHMYTCTNTILRGLGKLYSGGGEFTQNIDQYGGTGTADFVDRAIQIYCDRMEHATSAEEP